MSPGRVDRELVRRHLVALDSALQQLRRHAGRPLEALDDVEESWVVERGLQLCIQNCLDIATHLASSLGRDLSDYRSAIDALAGAGLLDRDFAERFRGVAGFRNVLVHGYLGIELERVHRFLNDNLADFEDFAAQIESVLGREG